MSEHVERKMNLLVVDDAPDNLMLLEAILESEGFNSIVLAESAIEAYQKLEEAKSEKAVDLILMDIMMPEMDGFQTLKEIRSNDKWSEVPVFAVTAKAMQSDKDVILNHGFTDYIPKPVNPTMISFKIVAAEVCLVPLVMISLRTETGLSIFCLRKREAIRLFLRRMVAR